MTVTLDELAPCLFNLKVKVRTRLPGPPNQGASYNHPWGVRRAYPRHEMRVARII